MPDKKNIKLTQEIRIWQTMIEKVIERNPGKGISIINVGPIFIGTAETGDKSIVADRDRPVAIEEKSEVPLAGLLPPASTAEEIYSMLEIVMDLLPQPRHDRLIRAMYELAHRKFDKVQDMTDWLGVPNSEHVYRWFRKFGLATKGRRKYRKD